MWFSKNYYPITKVNRIRDYEKLSNQWHLENGMAMEVIMKLIILINESPHNCLRAVSCALSGGAQTVRGLGEPPPHPVPLRILSRAECGLCRLHLKCLLSALRQGMSQRGREGREETANRRRVRGTPLYASLTHTTRQLLILLTFFHM